ncbi:MAG: hypothetical protein HN826_00940 [Methylococcales bacterium]|nr:hypothetical protein [Methylococcales bacterium]
MMKKIIKKQLGMSMTEYVVMGGALVISFAAVKDDVLPLIIEFYDEYMWTLAMPL